ncbi:MAG: ATP-binding protein [Acidobacteriota bacterium]
MKFSKATRKTAKARVALVGPSGSGKTMTALFVALGLVGKAGRIAVLDTERGSASKYAGDPDIPDFDACELSTFSPLTYVEGIREAIRAGYDAIVIDSLSHAWMGKDGALEQVDRAAKRAKSSFMAWREVTPMHNELVDALVQAPMHVLVTMRSKTEYVIEDDDRGKKVPRRVGIGPVQRDGLEYEFDVVGDMDLDNTLVVTKTRCRSLSGAVVRKPTVQLGLTLAAWLQQGEPVPTVEPETVSRMRELLDALPGAEAPVLSRLQIARLEDMPADKATHVMGWLESKLPKATPPATTSNPLGELAAALAGAVATEGTPGNGV